MIVTVKNFLRIATATIETGKVTILAGLNEAGKSSLLSGIAAVLTGRAIPIDGLPANQVHSLIHNHSSNGSVFIEARDGNAGIHYPECKRVADGIPPEATEWAAGLRSILDEPLKSRGDVIADLLKTLPSKDDLTKHLTKIGVGPKGIDTIYNTIEVSGWDGAFKQAQETGAKLKGQWEGITGERYGSKKIKEWLPAEWEADLVEKTEQSLSDDLKAENEWLEVAIADQAVNTADYARKKALADQAPALMKTIQASREQLSALKKNYQQISAGIKTMPQPVQPETQKCPCCNELLIVENGVISKPVILSDEEITTRTKAIEDAKASLERVRIEASAIETTLNTASASHTTAVNAAADIAKAKTSVNQSNHGTVEECRVRTDRAETRLRAFNQKAKATKLCADIEKNLLICERLSPAGLRLEKLTHAIDTFNDVLKTITDQAKWGVVTLNHNMTVTYRGFPFVLLSKSAKLRVRIALQLATVKLEGSPVVLIDEVDMLDTQGRDGLISAILFLHVNAILAMTVPKMEKCPNLSRIGGRTYWISNGQAEELHVSARN